MPVSRVPSALNMRGSFIYLRCYACVDCDELLSVLQIPLNCWKNCCALVVIYVVVRLRARRVVSYFRVQPWRQCVWLCVTGPMWYRETTLHERCPLHVMWFSSLEKVLVSPFRVTAGYHHYVITIVLKWSKAIKMFPIRWWNKRGKQESRNFVGIWRFQSGSWLGPVTWMLIQNQVGKLSFASYAEYMVL